MQRAWKISSASAVLRSDAQVGRVHEDGQAVGLKVRSGGADCRLDRHDLGGTFEGSLQQALNRRPLTLESETEDAEGDVLRISFFAEPRSDLAELDCSLGRRAAVRQPT